MIERVRTAIRDVSAAIIEPRFRALVDGDVHEKSPGEVVTIADREAEVALTVRLNAIVNAPVVGEENCAADPTRLALLLSERAWLVDPLDGTANFVAGSDEWAVMVALLEHGAPIASWMWQPMTGAMFVAERGAGAACNGAPIRIHTQARERAELRGAVLTKFLDGATAAAVERNTAAFAAITAGRYCAGFEYPAVINDEQDFAVFTRTLPWDHVPGSLLLTEAGGVARRPNGASFLPYADGVGLVLARDESAWEHAVALLS